MLKLSLSIMLIVVGFSAPMCRAAGLSSERTLPTHQAQDAYTPAAAFGAGEFLVVWQSGRLLPGDLRLGPRYQGDIVACRVSGAGEPLDAAPIIIADTADLKQVPRVVFGDNQFLVVWQDLRNGADWDVYAARVTPEGEVLDPNGILVSGGPQNQAMPRATWDGINFVVVWQDGRSDVKYEVYMARISPAGEVIEPAGVNIATGVSHYATPVAAPTNTAGSVFVFSTGSNETFSGAYMFPVSPTVGTFVTGGVPVTPPAYSLLHTDVPAQDPINKLPLTMAKGKAGYLLVWRTDAPGGRGNTSLINNMALFDLSGTRDTTMCYGLNRIMNPDVSWSGNSYVVVWHERFMPKTTEQYEVVTAAFIGEDGKLTDSLLNVAGTSAAPAAEACIASDTLTNNSLVAYEKHPVSMDTPIMIAYRMPGAATAISAVSSASEMEGSISFHPNPFNPGVDIFIRSGGGDVALRIYDIQGKEVADLTPSLKIKRDAKFLHGTWNASKQASGVYIAILTDGERVSSEKLFLMR
jgi:hypothetical protein